MSQPVEAISGRDGQVASAGKTGPLRNDVVMFVWFFGCCFSGGDAALLRWLLDVGNDIAIDASGAAYMKRYNK